MNKNLIIASCIALTFAIAFIFTPKIAMRIELAKIETTNQQVQEQLAKKSPTQNSLEVQFICQAPLETEANWVYHEESCEEAALIQAYNYELGLTTTPEEADKLILDMIAWQEANMGGHHDLYSEGMRTFATEYLGLKEEEFVTISPASIHQIKQQIDLGHPVIAPVTSQYLENPYYPHPGYHMLVVTGYTETHIITNDNGTRHGEDFAYEYAKFDKALQDAGGAIFVLNLQNN